VGIVDFSQEAKWLYMTESVTDLLGFEPHELIGRPSLELVHPDEFPRVRRLHYDTIQQDKAACLVYLRMRHKDPYRGYVLCGVSRTVVHNVLVGSVSFASPGAKALHNASTAQEITVITPSAANFEFRRWADRSPMPPSPVLPSLTLVMPPPRPYDPTDLATVSPTNPEIITFPHLPSKSFRTAFILDRFTRSSTIMYCSNDLLVNDTTRTIGKPFYDFVAKKDEGRVKEWVDLVKGWGVNEKGQPSDGGFGFGKFLLGVEARDSSERMPEPTSTPNRRERQGSTSKARTARLCGPNDPRYGRTNHRSHGTVGRRAQSPTGQGPATQYGQVDLPECEQFEVDAIFSAHSDGLMVILRRAS
ncbi:hypothetical protein BJ165DRAFT_1337665, partial [Panaeolus papilionaceus]